MKVSEGEVFDEFEADGKKVVFREVGRIPKGCNYYGRHYDEIILAKEILR